ncbi:MAG: CPBP family intramembrane metalloprotease [Salinivirgaceae bacterium]|nr:CPBP family intramembrane metalloprotease [Salinivirgaceae bacterium]
MKTKTHHIVAYSLLTILVSWSFFALFKLFGGKWEGFQMVIIGAIYMYFPLLSALIYKKIFLKNEKLEIALNFKLNYYWLFAWLIMPIIALLTFYINIQMLGYEYSADLTGYINQISKSLPQEQIKEATKQLQNLPIGIFWISLISALFSGISINALAAFGEEYGWRGFLFYLLKGKSFIKASLIIGFVWGIWHAPLILMGHNYPDHPKWGILMMIAFCILLSPIFNYVRIKTNSVIGVSILHGTLNASAGIAIIMLNKSHDLISGVTGLSGFLAIIIILLLITVYDSFISKDKIIFHKI